MQKEKKISKWLDFFLKIKEVVFVVGTAILWISAFWLSYNLAPYDKRISAMESNLGTLERILQSHEENSGQMTSKLDKIDREVGEIKGYLQIR